MLITLTDAIRSLGHYDQVIAIAGDTYEGIQWKNDPTLTKEEVETELEKLKLEQESKKYQELRLQEYPPFTDYLDGVVKGDQEQIQAYIDACLAVKAKYPKPS